MPIELLKSNVAKAKEIMKEFALFSEKLEQLGRTGGTSDDIRLLKGAVDNLTKQLEIVNNAVPSIIGAVQFYPKIEPGSKVQEKPGQKSEQKAGQKVEGLIKARYAHPKEPGRQVELAIQKKDRVKFLETEALAKSSAEKLEKRELKVKGLGEPAKPAELFIRLSNKYFRKTSESLIAKGYFSSLNRELRKITSPFLLHSYVSMIFFATALSAIFGFLITAVLLVFRQWLAGAAVFVLFPLTAFLLFFSYPSSERRSLEKGINQELPFVTIYMSAVATSGIEPTRIFEIIVRTKDYPNTQREIKKLLNYINFYGYDLVSALRYGSKNSPSERLAMLFSGLATTIRSGGELTEFLNKHSETLLFDYRLEREKYTKLAETFMDIYISIVIAAPMIMMILFVLISLTGYGSGFITPGIISLLIIFVVSILNIGFLVFLNIKQPKF